MQARYSKNLKNAPYPKIMSVEHARLLCSNCSRYFIKYSLIRENKQTDPERDVYKEMLLINHNAGHMLIRAFSDV